MFKSTYYDTDEFRRGLNIEEVIIPNLCECCGHRKALLQSDISKAYLCLVCAHQEERTPDNDDDSSVPAFWEERGEDLG
jgi:hypothetical protein